MGRAVKMPSSGRDRGPPVDETPLDNRRGDVPLAAVSSAMVRPHKEQFGRVPSRARSNFAGDDTVICVLEDALLAAETEMVEIGDAHRVQEQRLYFQTAMADESLRRSRRSSAARSGRSQARPTRTVASRHWGLPLHARVDGACAARCPNVRLASTT